MRVDTLQTFDTGDVFDVDVLIIGGGPAGLTLAREFFGEKTRVLVAESGGLEEAEEFEKLNSLESIGDPASFEQAAKRALFHGESTKLWTQVGQPYGVRCRVLGGASAAWAGKSAAFDEIDYLKRPWVPYSGWPVRHHEMEPYVDRASRHLNLGPNVYDERLWARMGVEGTEFNFTDFRSTFWQFARSRIDHLDVMRFGPEFMRSKADNVRVLLEATATEIHTTENGAAIESVSFASPSGVKARVRARVVVLATGAIENARLLLASRRDHAKGLGNDNDLVGRYLMDHPGVRLGGYTGKHCQVLDKKFGFYSVQDGRKSHLYMHGLALRAQTQERLGLTNCAIYMTEERSPDDPWDALKRLLKRSTRSPIDELMAIARSPRLLASGFGIKALQSSAVPRVLKDTIVNLAIRLDPNYVVGQYQSGGLPHKLTGLTVHAILENAPDPESRVSLSDQVDALGMPLPKVNWRLGARPRETLASLWNLLSENFEAAGVPLPDPEPWIANQKWDEAIIIDMAHSMGTTRMSKDPKAGVVDSNCQVHNVSGLYVAGSSIFPTSGHANPTLMIAAFAVRLADHLKHELSPRPVRVETGVTV